MASEPADNGPKTSRRRARQITPEEMAELARNSRLSTPSFVRIPAAAAASFGVGMTLGIMHGSKMRGLRFRAEHAHKLPSSTTGWYLYHRSKNYHMAFGGIKEGLRMGGRICFWTTAMFAIEDMFDGYRGSMDGINTVMASVAVAGGFSLWNRFPLIMAARTTKTALVVGLVYGGLQDLVSAARGRPIGYVEAMRRRMTKAQGTTHLEEPGI
ncbi:hypothetical protein RB595_001985 [Gaeumannomyces hyphopodioides]